ncbi:MAG: recombinase family protein [Patescibacteria group bacterium]
MTPQKYEIKPRAGVGYIRESTEDQDKGFSPDNQKRQIEEYAKRNNITVIEWYKDLITGTSATKRDDFQRMMADAEQKKFEAIIVYHTSRFARNVKEARTFKTHLREKLGIDVMSATQHFGDWKDPSAFLNEGVNELFDEHYSRQLSFWVRNSLMEKQLQGYQRGNPPFGYYKKRINPHEKDEKPVYEKKWRIHPKESKIVIRLYKLYATGKYSLYDLMKLMNKEGVTTKEGQPFTYSSVKSIISNKVYLGLVTSPRKKDLPDIPGKHPRIISDALFYKAQATLQKRRNTTGRPVAQHRFYLLQGIVYCYACRKWLEGKEHKPKAKMIPRMYCKCVPERKKNGQKVEHLYYSCNIKKETKQCAQPDAPCRVIDQQVLDFMEGFTVPEDIIQTTLEKLGKLFDQKDKAPKKNETAKAIQQLERKKKKLTFVFRNTDQLTEEQYLSDLREIDEKIAHHRQTAHIPEPTRGVSKAFALKETEKFLRDFRRFWHTDIGDEERRAWIQMCIRRIWVRNKRVVAIEPYDDFKPLFGSLEKVIAQSRLGTPYKHLPFFGGGV